MCDELLELAVARHERLSQIALDILLVLAFMLLARYLAGRAERPPGITFLPQDASRKHSRYRDMRHAFFFLLSSTPMISTQAMIGDAERTCTRSMRSLSAEEGLLEWATNCRWRTSSQRGVAPLHKECRSG